MTATAVRRDVGRAGEPARPRLRRFGRAARTLPSRDRVLAAGAVAAVLAGTAARFAAPRDMWLDEALSVEVARLPVPALLTALRHDGSPPLWYLLLHLWLRVAGDSPVATRALSGLAGLAVLPVAAALGRRVDGRRGALVALVLAATAPFAVRYSSESRMYSLVMLEVALGGLALVRAAERPTKVRLSLLTVATLALALTHYWTLFLLVVVAAGLLARRRWRLLAAMAAAGVLFLPQAPTLLSQSAHTGTPWAESPQPRAVVDTLLSWGGPANHYLGLWVGLALLGLALLGALTVRDGDRLVVAWRGDPRGRLLAGLTLGPLAVAVAVAMVTHSGFVIRYTAVAFPAYLLLVTLGVSRLPARAVPWTVAALAAGGLLTGTSDALATRTQAGPVARALAVSTVPRDVVVYCPDQLAPAVHRLLPPGRTEVSYGDPLGPTRVDWVDYAQRGEALTHQVDELAASYDALAGPGHALALVGAEGYRTLDGQCSQLATALGRLRPDGLRLVTRDPGQGESAAVVLFPAPTGPAVPERGAVSVTPPLG